MSSVIFTIFLFHVIRSFAEDDALVSTASGSILRHVGKSLDMNLPDTTERKFVISHTKNRTVGSAASKAP